MKKIFIFIITFATFCNSVEATDDYSIPETNPFFKFHIYNEGETYYDAENEKYTSFFSLSDNQKQALFDSAVLWNEILNTTASKVPTFAIYTIDDYNAYASSNYVTIADSDYKITAINAYINGKTITDDDYITQGEIGVGLGLMKNFPGWNYYTNSVALFQSKLPDLYSTMEHEIYHALGLGTNAKNNLFSDSVSTPISIWDKNLRIYQQDMSTAFDSSKILSSERGMSIKTSSKGEGTFDIVNYSPYFAGEETLKTLSGLTDSQIEAYKAEQGISNTEIALQKYIHSKGGLTNYSDYYSDIDTFPTVPGLPVNVIEQQKAELSHIELRNSFMSHQQYQNWAILMEAELAVLKDIGYENVTPRKYFGKSYYLDNTIDTFASGYGEWNGSSYSGYSSIENGIGLHIYSDNNVIMQTGNTLSQGKHTIGTRIDGVKNTYSLSNANIDVQGDGSIGIAVTWGKEHTVNIDNTSKVSASGNDGIGISLDFGKNVMGGLNEDRGSYSNFNGTENKIPPSDIQGALVDNINITGEVEGKKEAIYISENAYVKNINIGDGASINGNIKSDWNSLYSGERANVLMKNDEDKWVIRDITDISNILFTNMNFTGESNIEGKITGENPHLNTLKINNSGTVNYKGDDINVYTIDNTGTININKSTDIAVSNGKITGAGTIDVKQNGGLALNKNVDDIQNTVNLDSNTFLSTLNDNLTEIQINKLNTNNTRLIMDLGDKLKLAMASDDGKNTATISMIKVNKDEMAQLEDGSKADLFSDESQTIDISGSSNVYYNGNKYSISQNSSNKKELITVKDSSTTYELSDAVEDSSTPNYLVTENVLTKDAGTVKSAVFEIEGKDINVNGNKGLVVDLADNSNGTTLKTGISGASDSNLTVQNGGNITVSAENKEITLGRTSETAITLNNGTAYFDASTNGINVKGSIKGNNNTTDKIGITGNRVNIAEINNVSVISNASNLTMNNNSTNTNWQIETGTLNVSNDNYLSSDGTNNLTFSGGGVNLQNGTASDIKLSGLTLNDDIKSALDVDLKNQTADRFVFDNPNNVITNGKSIDISNINLINPNTALTKEKYEIPIANSKYNSEKLSGHITANIDRPLLTPVYKYSMTYEDDGTQGNIAINRAKTGGYNDYNPAIYTGAVAAQAGGYLNQINSYDTAFSNMDMLMAMPQNTRTAMKYRNKYAAEGDGANLMTYNPNQLPQEGKGIWARPYASFEKIGMKNGPKVGNTSYGSYFGGDTDVVELSHGWDAVFSGYAGYTGSHQHYDGNSIYQNGGQIGATSVFYKNKFFTGLTANVGSSIANASTMYGHDDIVLLTTGVASKTGYNIGFKNDKFIIQPSWLMSYSFVNTFDYTNAAGVRVKSNPLNAMQLVPGVKLIGNLKNGWQPYLGVQMVWNIMDKAKFRVNDAYLEQISIKPYVQYGIGVQKQTGERLTGYAQSMVRNGGRNGVSLSAGFRLKV